MEKESIDKISSAVTRVISNIDINDVDKLEMLININQFLDNYDNSIKVLQKDQYEKSKIIYNQYRR